MRLGDTLKEIKAGFRASADPAVVATMQQVTRDLEASGIVARARKVGDRAPQFVLEDARGVGFALSDFLLSGPLVLHFFRGFW